MTQIDRAGAIFAKLEEQNSKSVFGLTQKKELRSKLQAEVCVVCVIIRIVSNDTVYPIESQICTYICFLKGTQGSENEQCCSITSDKRTTTRPYSTIGGS